jgi:hypothetical protein
MVQLPILNLSVVSSSLRSFAYSSLRSAQNPLVNMRFQHVAAAGLTTSAVAVNLFVSSYSGIVTSLQLAPSAQGHGIGADEGSLQQCYLVRIMTKTNSLFDYLKSLFP